MRPRLQFSLRFLLAIVLAVCCFLGGMAVQKRLDEPHWLYQAPPLEMRSAGGYFVEHIRLRDGTEWQRIVRNPEPEHPRKPMAPTSEE